MELNRYLKLMDFPQEWVEWDVLPLDFIERQANSYKPGHEVSSEHDRHAVFQWLLKQRPSVDNFVLLARLSWLDPDQVMARSVRELIARQASGHTLVASALETPYHRA